jgi:hypothetical protein
VTARPIAQGRGKKGNFSKMSGRMAWQLVE